jgi:calcineurin-like phosphoesterase family protein
MTRSKSFFPASPLFAQIPGRTWSAWLVLVLASTAANAQPTFSIPQRDLPTPLVMVAYGDMRFTAPSETNASNPPARRALVARVAAEHPAAIFLNGDIPWHGNLADYAVYRDETSSWRDAQLRVYPALGNHEFSGCEEAQCLALWWDAFPALRPHRWYSVALGEKVLAIALDSDTSMLPGSDQRVWLEQQIAGLSPRVRFVVIFLHHPPVADLQTGDLADHNPRPNEVSLADYLGGVAPKSRARFFVSAGHTHNYERFLYDGIVYLVSGGGGASPYPVVRGASDLYRSAEFPNYHYVRLELRANQVIGEMFRLRDYTALAPAAWEMKDRFEISLRP